MNRKNKKILCIMLAFLFVAESLLVGSKYGIFDMFSVNAAGSTDYKLPKSLDYNEYSLGTVNNPFVILEITPYEGYAEIGYLVKGQEPVSMEQVVLNGAINAIGSGGWAINVSPSNSKKKFYVEDESNITSLANPSQYTKLENRYQYGYFKRMADGDGDYVQLITACEAVNMPGGAYDYVDEQLSELTEDNKNIGYYIYVGDGNGSYDVSDITDAVYRKVKKGETGTLNWYGLPEFKDGNIEVYTLDGYNAKPYTYEEANHNNALSYDKKVYTYMEKAVYEGYIYVYESCNRFAKDIMRIDDDEASDYVTKVVTVTPDELNKNPELIDQSDLIYITPKSHVGALNGLWKSYANKKLFDGTIHEEREGFDHNDLTFETAKKLFIRTCVEEKSALIYDIETYQKSYNTKNVALTKYYADGTPVSSDVARGDNYYGNNIVKLYIMMHVMDPVTFYNNYIKTGKIDENGNYIEQTGDAAAYWGILTFCPFEIYDDYADMGHVYNFADLGFETNLYNNNNNDTVRNNYFTFNGNTATTQNIVNGWHINNQGYTSDAFDFFKNSGEDIRYSGDENHMSPADAIYYLLHRDKTYEDEINRDMVILEIEAGNRFKSDAYFKTLITNTLPEFTGDIKVVRQTSAEFICSNIDLNSEYDMIFIGTYLNGNTIDGEYSQYAYIHSGRGTYKVRKSLWDGLDGKSDCKNVIKSGNDLTGVSVRKLEDYINGKLPVIFAKGFYSDPSNRIIDNYKGADKTTNMRVFLTTYNDSRTYCEKGLDRKNLRKIMTEKMCNIDMLSEPKEYVDKTASVNEGKNITDADIYVNGENINNKVLEYRFTINNTIAEDTYTLNLYIDSNADGKFDTQAELLNSVYVYDETLSRNVDIKDLAAGHTFKVTRSVDKLVGILPWRLELVNNSNSSIRDSKIGYCALKASANTEKETIKILQIAPDSDIISVALPTDEEIAGKTKIEDFRNNTVVNGKVLPDNLSDITGKFWYYTKDLDCFDIHFTRLTINEVSDMIKNNPYYFSEFDMLILGFCDKYPEIDDRNLLQGVVDFANTGKAVLFAHDVLMYNWNKERDNTKENLNASYFREMLGMDRYGVRLNKDEREGKDSVYIGSDITTSEDLSKYIQGYTTATIDCYDQNLKQYTRKTTKVTNNNTGQITTYPYNIDKEFDVAETHSQYFQLDLETDDITVWYSLGGDYYNQSPNDGRNNYYIYNIGNITYTGMGHMKYSKRTTFKLSDMEIKLFVNTMIAAYRSSAAPVEITITNTDATDNGENAFLYVDYDATESENAIGSGITTVDGVQYKRIYFMLQDKSIVSNKTTEVVFHMSDENGNTDVSKNEGYQIFRTSDNIPVDNTSLTSGVEYYIDVPVTQLNSVIMEKLTIEAKVRFGKAGENVISSNKNAIIMKRALFELD